MWARARGASRPGTEEHAPRREVTARRESSSCNVEVGPGYAPVTRRSGACYTMQVCRAGIGFAEGGTMRRIAVVVALTGALSSSASAAPCENLTNPIYAQVGDTQANLMKRLGRALRDNTTKPITLVWITSGSCANIQT